MTETDYQIDTLPSAVPMANGVSITPTGLLVQRHLSYAEWADVGRKLAILDRATQWAIGDWLNYGELKYSDTYNQVADATGYKPSTLMNLKFVAGRFPVSRRRENLSFAHHAEVAGLDAMEQDLWLDSAAKEQWTVKRLRAEVRPDDLDHLFNLVTCPECGHEWRPG